MKLIYLSSENLKDKDFVREFVYGFKYTGKALLLHATFGDVRDTRFVTKRISALLSEQLVVNHANSGDQRNLLRCVDGGLELRKELVEQAFGTVTLFILNNLLAGEGAPSVADPLELLPLIRREFSISETILFPAHMRSPLTAKPLELKDAAEIDRLLGIYEEESNALELARNLLPVTMASPSYFLPVT